MSLKRAASLFVVAMEAEIRDKTWQRWLAIYPEMVKGYIKFTDYETYHNELVKPKITTKQTTAEIIDFAERVRKADIGR